MPLYDHECEAGHITEAFMPYEGPKVVFCSQCREPAKRIVSFGKHARTVDVFNPYVEENITSSPVLVESKQHLAQLCKQHGVRSRALSDGYRSYEGRREI